MRATWYLHVQRLRLPLFDASDYVIGSPCSKRVNPRNFSKRYFHYSWVHALSLLRGKRGWKHLRWKTVQNRQALLGQRNFRVFVSLPSEFFNMYLKEDNLKALCCTRFLFYDYERKCPWNTVNLAKDSTSICLSVTVFGEKFLWRTSICFLCSFSALENPQISADFSRYHSTSIYFNCSTIFLHRREMSLLCNFVISFLILNHSILASSSDINSSFHVIIKKVRNLNGTLVFTHGKDG